MVHSLCEGVGGLGHKLGALGLGGLAHTVKNGESDLRVVELGGGGTGALRGLAHTSADHLDVAEGHTVLSSHSVEDTADSTGEGGVTEFLARVHGSGTRVPTEVNAHVLHNVRALLLQLANSEHLSVGALHLVVLTHELPELRLGDDVVRREACVPEQLRGGLGLRRLLASHDLELAQVRAGKLHSRLSHFVFLFLDTTCWV